MGLEYKPGEMTAEEYGAHWQDWISQVGKDGTVESSLPFEWSGKLITGDKVTDLELKDVDMGGYMIISAKDMDDAVAVAKEAPHMKLGGTTIVRKCVE